MTANECCKTPHREYHLWKKRSSPGEIPSGASNTDVSRRDGKGVEMERKGEKEVNHTSKLDEPQDVQRFRPTLDVRLQRCAAQPFCCNVLQRHKIWENQYP